MRTFCGSSEKEMLWKRPSIVFNVIIERGIWFQPPECARQAPYLVTKLVGVESNNRMEAASLGCGAMSAVKWSANSLC